MLFSNIMGLFGGLALFLYGMQMMSTGLEAAAGNKMKVILAKLTANRFVGVLVGMLITAVIQSSSATTVMVVGFVNSGMMTLGQAVWIIMGANIGTTITGQLIALDVGELAPILAFVGVAAIVFLKNDKVRHIGEIFAGLGVLFIGMDMMSSAMQPLADSPSFAGLLTKFENPILGILAGTVFTALIQSSSASVGILQALAASGAVGLKSAAYVLFGQNIGTCVTALLASVGTSINAKRTTIIHILFNVFGTVVFIIIIITYQSNIIHYRRDNTGACTGSDCKSSYLVQHCDNTAVAPGWNRAHEACDNDTQGQGENRRGRHESDVYDRHQAYSDREAGCSGHLHGRHQKGTYANDGDGKKECHRGI